MEAKHEPDNELERLMMLKENSQNRQLESTKRSMVVLAETEEIGVRTAEELLRQGEALDRTEKNLDKIQELSKVNQKHINGLKGMFSGFKNWLFGPKEGEEQKEPEAERPRNLEKVINNQDQSKYTPDVSGLFDDVDAKQTMSRSQSAPNSSDVAEARLNENLNMLGAGVSRLKDLASGLGDEIESSNQQLNRLQMKTESADITIDGQTRQMKRILRGN